MEKSNICRCCLIGGCCKDLNNSYFYCGTQENYGEMLMKTFNVTLDSKNMFICEECVIKLRDAAAFKQQIIEVSCTLNEPSQNVSNIDNESEELFDVKLKTTDEVIVIDGDDASISNETECSEIDGVVEKIQGEQTTKQKDTIHQTQKSQINLPQGGMDVYRTINKTLKLISNSNICLFKSLKTKYACYVCNKVHFDIKDLRKHSQMHSIEDFRIKVRKLRGMTSINADITNLKCNCTEICKDLDVLTKHLREVHDIALSNAKHLLKPFKLEDGFHCVICKETFKTFTRLSIHMNTHATNNVCEICGLAYFNRSSLRGHVRGQHKEKKCAKCPLKFATSALLYRHLVKAHNKARVKYYCQRCDMIFPYQYRLKNHMVELHGDKHNTVDCSECGKTVKSDYYLKIHIRNVHLKERNYPCSLCDLCFFTKTDKTRHERTHQNSSKYNCFICDTKFKTKDSVRRHMKRQHTGHGMKDRGR